MNLREGLKEARKLGCNVFTIPCTGEVAVISPKHRLRLNNRRKDAPRVLISMIRRLRQESGA